MLDALRDRFARAFGRAPERAARAPGRVNLIGEHTDYNEGLVLPCAIDRDTVVMLAPRDDGRFRLVSREQPTPGAFRAGDPPAGDGDWVDYARGVVATLAERGRVAGGADVAIASDVPPGSGLSSSAALCVALVTALDAAFGFQLTPAERSRVAHRAESGFVGVPCGVMDPFASALAEPGAALRIDCRSLEVRRAPLPAERLRLLIAHSGVTRSLADGRYAARRAECARALAGAREAGLVPAGARALRDLAPGALPALEPHVPPACFRRARHVVTENARVDGVVAALAAGDLARAGATLRAGMASLRDDFAVSTPELDRLCALGDAAPGVFGSRLTGAGFGGCTLHLVEAASAGAAAEAIARGFRERFGRTPPVVAVRPAAGASVLEI